MNRVISDDRLYHFGPFCLDEGERVLLRDGHLVPLAPKALSTLLVLVRNMGHVVEKNFLMNEVWPDEDVPEGKWLAYSRPNCGNGLSRRICS